MHRYNRKDTDRDRDIDRLTETGRERHTERHI